MPIRWTTSKTPERSRRSCSEARPSTALSRPVEVAAFLQADFRPNVSEPSFQDCSADDELWCSREAAPLSIRHDQRLSSFLDFAGLSPGALVYSSSACEVVHGARICHR